MDHGYTISSPGEPSTGDHTAIMRFIMSDAEYESVHNKKFRLKWSGDSLSHYSAKLFMPCIINVTATSVNCYYRQKCESLSPNVT